MKSDDTFGIIRIIREYGSFIGVISNQQLIFAHAYNLASCHYKPTPQNS